MLKVFLNQYLTDASSKTPPTPYYDVIFTNILNVGHEVYSEIADLMESSVINKKDIKAMNRLETVSI